PHEPFAAAHQDLAELAGVTVDTKTIERTTEAAGATAEQTNQSERTAIVAGRVQPIAPASRLYVAMDGTGVPVLPRDTEGRVGKGPEGRAKTREAKLGCVFTQTSFDEEGWPVRDPGSTTYVGAIEVVDDFGQRLKQSGMRWTVVGANAVITLRCRILSNPWDDLWRARRLNWHQLPTNLSHTH